MTASRSPTNRWEFKARFRRHAFGWKSQPAISRVKQAVAEIKKVAKADPLLAAEGAVLFLERVSPAIEHVDSSSGSIGTAVSQAIDALAAVIAAAPADEATRTDWLDRLWEACEQDDIPYLEGVGDVWGGLCKTPTLAAAWADRLLPAVRSSWDPSAERRSYFRGTSHCLSALLAAGRYEELLALLELDRHHMWHHRQYGVRALAGLGRVAEAVRYAHAGAALNDDPRAIARVCEDVLLAAGQRDEAYPYALIGRTASTYVARFRAIASRYPEKKAADVLADLVRSTPGDEGKWFAAAKDTGLLDLALALARHASAEPRTLIRAARDHAVDEPAFAVEVGLLGIEGLLLSHGYGELTTADAVEGYRSTMEAADQLGKRDEVRGRIRVLVDRMNPSVMFVSTFVRLLAADEAH